MRLVDAFLLIALERSRQRKLKAEGRFKYMLSDRKCSNETRLACLVEEVGEVARALQKAKHDGNTNLVEELTQVAALATAWLESLKKPAEKPTATPKVDASAGRIDSEIVLSEVYRSKRSKGRTPAGLLHDRIHPTSGRLISAKPIKVKK
jgi:NTP pyrophosphatase (non-canonical NTP hydrolase)